MLPLMERLEFNRRYSRARDYFASRFAHGLVLEFFLKTAIALGFSFRLNKKYRAQPGAWLSPVSYGNTPGVEEKLQRLSESKFRLAIGSWPFSTFCGPITRRRRSCENQTGVRSPIFPNGKNGGSQFGELKFSTCAVTRLRAQFDDESGVGVPRMLRSALAVRC